MTTLNPEAADPAEPSASARSGDRTRTQILEAAETLFSEHGLDGVSMRQIAEQGQVTLALVNYHFGSKDKLYRAVFERRIVPVSGSRRQALARVLANGGKVPPIREVLDALARPWVEMRREPGGMAYTRLIARECSDPAEGRRGIVADLLDPIAIEFTAAMQKALPHMEPRKVAWAYHFFIGALLLMLANPDRVTRLSGDLFDVREDQAVIDEIVDFFCAALAVAPAAVKPAKSKAKDKPKTNPKETR